MTRPSKFPVIAIACGGTGGHLFPGLAVADALEERGCEITLLVSQKEVDQEAVKSAAGMRVVSLPAVGLQKGRWAGFARGFWRSFQQCSHLFARLRPEGVLAMGGFTSAPPVLAGKKSRSATFLHESNSIPGRANRWLSPWVDEVFVGFSSAARRIYNQCIRRVGTPVRSEFIPTDAGACRMALSLKPEDPVLLIMGGSQGARAINELVANAISILAVEAPALQFLHLTGSEDHSKLQAIYARHSRRACVRPFLTEMELALGAATLAINRAGASSLAELAAMEVPAILIPYPHATENHQLENARALAGSGAARILVESSTTPEMLARETLELLRSPSECAAIKSALRKWQFPEAAAEMANCMLDHIGIPRSRQVLNREAMAKSWRSTSQLAASERPLLRAGFALK